MRQLGFFGTMLGIKMTRYDVDTFLAQQQRSVIIENVSSKEVKNPTVNVNFLCLSVQIKEQTKENVMY